MSMSRLPNGLSTRKSIDPFGNYTAPDPTDEHRFFDDFNVFSSTSWTSLR